MRKHYLVILAFVVMVAVTLIVRANTPGAEPYMCKACERTTHILPGGIDLEIGRYDDGWLRGYWVELWTGEYGYWVATCKFEHVDGYPDIRLCRFTNGWWIREYWEYYIQKIKT